MSAEFMLDSGDGGNASTYGEFYLTRTVPGEASVVRERLAAASERLGYAVISDDPLIVRKGGAGHGAITSTVLGYARTLTFRLKQSSAGTTSVSFNYVGYPLNYKNARLVITREAEAMVALASSSTSSQPCSACGATGSDDSRFCRRCGSPIAAEPAELQIMRMTDSAHAGTKDMLVGVIAFALAILTFGLIIGTKGIDHFVAASIFSAMWAVPGSISMMLGFRHLSRALGAPDPQKALAPGPAVVALTEVSATSELPQPSLISVTESTTSLLAPPHEEKIK